MNKVSEMSLYPKFKCLSCKEKLWIVRSEKTQWKEILQTMDGRKHLKTRCNLTKMSIHKVKFRCTNCKYLWVEDAPVDSMEQTCSECGCNILTLSLYNDTIANIDDDILEDEDCL